MKRSFVFLILISVATGCDPSSVMDANIENATLQPLSITFVSSLIGNRTLTLDPDETVLFQDGFSTTGGFLQPDLVDYDSVYIENQSAQILKIFKPDTPGKNIYLIEDYWTLTEPDKRVYKYDYTINPEDLE